MAHVDKYYIDPVLTQKIQQLRECYREAKPVANALNTEAFKQYLRSHPNGDKLYDYLINGFPLWLNKEPQNLSTKPANFVKTIKEAYAIIDNFVKELQNGAVSPTISPLKFVIPVFTVPKKDKNGNLTLYRIVRHGSFAEKYTTCINKWISRRHCKMPTLPKLVTYVEILIDKTFMAMRDMADAFRQILARMEETQYLGYSICGLQMKDNKQPYGISSAAANCQTFAQLIIWILETYYFPKELHGQSVVHIDDFLFAAKTKLQCISMHTNFDKLCEELNVKISAHKNVNAVTKGIVYGLEWDLRNKTVGLPQKKKEKYKQLIELTIKYNGVIEGKALESLSGRIMYMAQFNRAAKALCYNLLYFINDKLRSDKKSRTKWYKLPQYVLDDLNFWLEYMDNITTVRMETIIYKPKTAYIASTDASQFAGGFVIGKLWSFFNFPKQYMHWNIAQKEAYVILILLLHLERRLTDKKLELYTDNQILYWGLCRKWSPKPTIMMFVYEICLILVRSNIHLWVEWVPTKNNKWADALSRLQIQRFYELNKIFKLNLNGKPDTIKHFNKFQFIKDKKLKEYYQIK